eukprot:5989284-Prymnesium_polylepis.1
MPAATGHAARRWRRLLRYGVDGGVRRARERAARADGVHTRHLSQLQLAQRARVGRPAYRQQRVDSHRLVLDARRHLPPRDAAPHALPHARDGRPASEAAPARQHDALWRGVQQGIAAHADGLRRVRND